MQNDVFDYGGAGMENPYDPQGHNFNQNPGTVGGTVQHQSQQQTIKQNEIDIIDASELEGGEAEPGAG